MEKENTLQEMGIPTRPDEMPAYIANITWSVLQPLTQKRGIQLNLGTLPQDFN